MPRLPTDVLAKRAALAVLLAACASVADAQVPRYPLLGDEFDRYLAVLALGDSGASEPLMFRSGSALTPTRSRVAARDHLWAGMLAPPTSSRGDQTLWLEPLAPTLTVTYNSAFPWGANDGPTWAGKGLTTTLHAGARARWRFLTLTLYPAVTWSQNRPYPTVLRPDSNRYAESYPWHRNIDWPQRQGPDAFARLDLGQTELRADVGWFTAGLSNESLWWGPAIQNPIIMSSTAPGFPHLDLGTGRPVSIGVGRLELRTVWGALRESPWFDTIPDNDWRLFSGVTVGFAPDFVPGLTVGATRIYYQTWDDSLRFRDAFRFAETVFKFARITPDNPEGDDRGDQMLSLMLRWRFPTVGFEAYAEWARNDHNVNLRDFLLEPDHSQGFTVGFQYAFPPSPLLLPGSEAPLPSSPFPAPTSIATQADGATNAGEGRDLAPRARWHVAGEWTHLERSRTREVRGSPIYYTHHITQQGYTNRGQLLGAAIGPGASSLHLRVNRYTDKGRVGGFAQWVRKNNDYYYAQLGDTLFREGHDVELTVGLSAFRFVGDFDLGLGIAVTRNLNRYYRLNNDVTNFNARMSVGWGR